MASSVQPSFARKRMRAWVILRTRSTPDLNMLSSCIFSSSLKLTTYLLAMPVSLAETDYHPFTYQSMCDKLLVSTNYFSAANTFARPRERSEIFPLICYRMGFHSAIWRKPTMEWSAGRNVRRGDWNRPVDNLDRILCPIPIRSYQLMGVMQNRCGDWGRDYIPLDDIRVTLRMMD